MDDFIQVLVYLIIIISILIPLFKKKEKQPQKQMPQRKPETWIPESRETAPETNQQESDIFEEISDLFKNELPQKPEPGRRKTNIEQRSESKSTPAGQEYSSEESKRTESEHVSYERGSSAPEHSSTYSEHNLDINWHQYTDWTKTKKPKIDPAVENRAEIFKMLLEKKSSGSNIYNFKIRDTLKHPQSLKEYILISEILGRPKAFRK